MDINRRIGLWPSDGWTYEDLVAAKGDTTITLCFPCRDESATVGSLVASSRRTLMDETGLVDEILVIDDRSTDDSALVASDAGARVVDIEEVHRIHGVGRGKGNALWASLVSSESDLMVWCDSDLTNFCPSWVAKLLLPLLHSDEIHLVKASYVRREHLGGGGRTTELVARPILSLLYPELASLAQPLAGEYAVRRSVVDELCLVEGWGVEIGMLIDVTERYGVSSIAQVDLGTRRHSHQSLESLSVQAAEVLHTALVKLPVGGPDPTSSLVRADGTRVPLNTSARLPIHRYSANREAIANPSG